MCLVEISELGSLLRARRTAAGRTIASVAVDAGLSVPYIANLENGRGNPTLSAVSRLATALGAHLAVELTAGDADASPPTRLPDSLLRFAKSARFIAESARLATAADAPETATRERLLHAMAGMAALATRPVTDTDWHRLLDAAILMTV
jgi:transcriptional regulator with XRE-family HTH domain